MLCSSLDTSIPQGCIQNVYKSDSTEKRVLPALAKLKKRADRTKSHSLRSAYVSSEYPTSARANVQQRGSLPPKVLKRLEESWAGTFYHQVFVCIDKSLFAELYSDEPSRPNIPIKFPVRLEVLKSSFGWSDKDRLQLLHLSSESKSAHLLARQSASLGTSYTGYGRWHRATQLDDRRVALFSGVPAAWDTAQT